MKNGRLAEKLFMILILILFAAFLVLWLKVDSMIPRYIVGALLIAAAFAYKAFEKKHREKEDSLPNDNDQNPKDA